MLAYAKRRFRHRKTPTDDRFDLGPQCDKIKSLMPADSSRPESASKSPTLAAAGITLSSSTEVTFKESSEPEVTPDAADSVV